MPGTSEPSPLRAQTFATAIASVVAGGAPLGLSIFAGGYCSVTPSTMTLSLVLAGVGIVLALLSVIIAFGAGFRAASLGFAVPVIVLLFLWTGTFRTDCNSSNKPSAVSHIRTINTAQVTYASANGGAFGTISELVAAGLLDSRFLDQRGVSGYHFSVAVQPQSYTAFATPDAGFKGDRFGRFGYASNEDAVVRYSTDPNLAPPGQVGQPIQ